MTGEDDRPRPGRERVKPISPRKLDELKATAEALSTVGDCITAVQPGQCWRVAAFAAAIRGA